MKQNSSAPSLVLAETLLRIPSREKMRIFLEGLLTQKELEEFVIRLEIVKRLKLGQSQRQIANDLGVGVATITRGSKELQKGNFNYA